MRSGAATPGSRLGAARQAEAPAGVISITNRGPGACRRAGDNEGMKPHARATRRRHLPRLGDETHKSHVMLYIVVGSVLVVLGTFGLISLFELFVGF